MKLISLDDKAYTLEIEKTIHTLPRVTKVMESAGIVDMSAVPKHLLEAGRQFGTAVHSCCAYYDKGTLARDLLDPALEGYLEGWIKFRKETPWAKKTPALIEGRVYSLAWGYAGTLDRYWKTGELVDIKTGEESAAGIQLAAYAEALKEMTGQKTKTRLVVKLLPGDYKIIRHNDVADWRVFCAALTIHNYKKRR